MDHQRAGAAILFPRLTLREADMRSEERRGRDGREGCGAEWLSHNVVICHVVSTAQLRVTTRAKAQARRESTDQKKFLICSPEHRS